MGLTKLEEMDRKTRRQKKRKVFVPTQVPRFLPGECPPSEIKRDLKAYNRHLFNVFYARPTIDNKPPRLQLRNYINQSRLRAEAIRLEEIDQDNKELLKKINYINRMGGKVDCYNMNHGQCSNWPAHKQNMLRIAQDNVFFYHQLMAIKSEYEKSKMDQDWKKMVEKMKHMAKYTLQMCLKKSIDRQINEMPSISGLNTPLEEIRKRPHCFLDFRIKDSIPMGRVVIQLYSDMVPKSCENFLSICKGTNGLTYRNCKVYNVVKGQYFECGDITLNNGKGGCSIYGDEFEQEKLELKHTKPGVVSMVPVKKTFNNSKFSITFAEHPTLDSKRVVIGRVVKGMKTVFHVQDLGRRIGGPIVPIVIDKCGEFQIKPCPSRGGRKADHKRNRECFCKQGVSKGE